MDQDTPVRDTVEKDTIENRENVPYRITVDKNDFVVRLNQQFFQKEAISRFLDFLSVEIVRTRSQATEQEIEQLAKEVKQKAWSRVKDQFFEPV
ncbi:MAG: hypothetical protein AAF702_19490 [Chloroflexota bacterium]